MEEQQSTPSTGGLANSFKAFVTDLLKAIRSITNIADNAQPEQTMQGIQRDIEFKGYNIWILIFSIFICSIGLNVNSTAVVIGAMLISPLMGPIVGVGLSVGIYDWATLKKSLMNLSVAVGFAVATSTIYFLITPLSDAQSELLARTRPHLLDVFIAFFGGLAGILAGSRKEKTNVVPGVAIATALMPPLCTAGYGLATQQWNFFFGAFYLFLINSAFISLATTLVVRYLRFPAKVFMDERRKRMTKRSIAAFTVLLVVPAGWVFYNVVTESLFNRRIDQFMNQVVEYEGAEVVKRSVELTDTSSTLRVVLLGNQVPPEVIGEWKRQLPQYGLASTELRVFQGQDGLNRSQAEVGKMVDLYTVSQEQLRTKDQIISDLQIQLLRYQKDEMPLQQLAEELVVQFPELRRLSYAEKISLSPGAAPDTIPAFGFQWQAGLSQKEVSQREQNLAKLLRVRLQIDTLLVE